MVRGGAKLGDLKSVIHKEVWGDTQRTLLVVILMCSRKKHITALLPCNAHEFPHSTYLILRPQNSHKNNQDAPQQIRKL